MPGGVFDRSITLSACQAACARRFPNCVAINVIVLPSGDISCYLVPQLLELVSSPSADYYQAIIDSGSDCQITSMLL